MAEAMIAGAGLDSASSAPSTSPTGRPKTGDPSEKGEQGGFSSLLGVAMSQGAGDPAMAAKLQPADAKSTSLLAALGDGTSNKDGADGDTAVDAQGTSLPLTLPTLAVSGLIGVANGKQAAAMTVKGDGDKLQASSPVLARDLSQALRQALVQQQSSAINQPASTTQDTDLTSALTVGGLFNDGKLQPNINAMTQAFAEQLSKETTHDAPRDIKTSAPANIHSNTSSLHSLSSLSGQMAAGSRTDGGNGPTSISVPPQHPQWAQQVGDRVQWMVGHNLQRADIRLNPPDLGSLEVRIHVGNDHQTHISFSSPHAHVRDALEAAMPRLREMMHDSGLNLANADVSQHSFAGSQMHDPRGEGGAGSGAGHHGDGDGDVDLIAGADPAQNLPVRQLQGLVDYYA
jgi:flagellar hook-length control protein FliK